MMRNELLRLKLLREAFPQLSDEDVAQAYSSSSRNFDEAAAALKAKVEALAAEHRKSGWITVTNTKNYNNRSSSQPQIRMGDKKKKQKARHSKKKGDTPQEQDIKNPDRKQAGYESRQLEEFLFCMLGDEAEIGMDIVRDVIHQCDGDAQKSLDSLLEIALSCDRQTTKYRSLVSMGSMDDAKLLVLLEAFPAIDAAVVIQHYNELGGDVDAVTNMLLEHGNCRNSSLNPEVQRVLKRINMLFPNVDKHMLLEILKAHDFNYSATMETLAEAGMVPQKIVDNTVAKLPQGNVVRPSEVKDPPKVRTPSKLPVRNEIKRKPPKQENKADEWGEYKQLCNTFADNWSAMKHCFQEATSAYHNGDPARASLLSQKGQEYKKVSREAREKASKHVFLIHNKEYQNNVTIDLHNQHVEEAIQLVERHLNALGSISSSVHTLTLITGYGVHSQDGKPRLKAAVIEYLNKRRVEWVELNPGRMLVNLDTLKT